MNSIRGTTHLCIGRNSHLFLEWTSKDRLIVQLTVNIVSPYYLKNRVFKPSSRETIFMEKPLSRWLGEDLKAVVCKVSYVRGWRCFPFARNQYSVLGILCWLFKRVFVICYQVFSRMRFSACQRKLKSYHNQRSHFWKFICCTINFFNCNPKNVYSFFC